MSDQNFGDNPFADPAIQRATQNAQITQNSLEEYNPFAQQNVVSKPAAIIPTSVVNAPTTNIQPTPAISTQSIQPPPYASSAAQQTNATKELERQQQELERRAAELDRREQMINAPTGGLVKNFPPLPSWCPGPLKPCFYQDINREIPVEFQRWVRILFYLWMFHSLTLALNILAALVVFIIIGKGTTFGFSILFFVLFTPLSYVCWFRPAYKGFRSDSSVNFMLFFFAFFLQCIFSVIACFGDEWFCGIILLISVFSTIKIGNVIAGMLVMMVSLSFVAIATADILMLIKIHRLYRNTGASFEKAQSEFATSVMSNKNVQNAAATVVTESARAAMQGTAQTSYGSPGRF